MGFREKRFFPEFLPLLYDDLEAMGQKTDQYHFG